MCTAAQDPQSPLAFMYPRAAWMHHMLIAATTFLWQTDAMGTFVKWAYGEHEATQGKEPSPAPGWLGKEEVWSPGWESTRGAEDSPQPHSIRPLPGTYWAPLLGPQQPHVSWCTPLSPNPCASLPEWPCPGSWQPHWPRDTSSCSWLDLNYK